MRTKINLYKILIIMLCIHSCHSPKGIFKTQKHINHNYNEVPKTLIGEVYATDCIGYNNLMVLKDYVVFDFWFTSENILVVCDKTSGSIIPNKTIFRGRGAEEYSDSQFVQSISDTSQNLLWIAADIYNKLVCINIESGEKETIQGEPSAYVAAINPQKEIFYISVQTQEQNKLILKSKENKRDTIGYLYQSPIDITNVSSTYSFTHSHLVMGMFSYNGVYFFSLSSPDKSFFVKVRDNNPQEQYYLSSFATDQYICLLYTLQDGGRELHLLNFDGSIKEIYHINENLDYITYDKFENTIYGIDKGAERVYRYVCT